MKRFLQFSKNRLFSKNKIVCFLKKNSFFFSKKLYFPKKWCSCKEAVAFKEDILFKQYFQRVFLFLLKKTKKQIRGPYAAPALALGNSFAIKAQLHCFSTLLASSRYFYIICFHYPRAITRNPSDPTTGCLT